MSIGDRYLAELRVGSSTRNFRDPPCPGLTGIDLIALMASRIFHHEKAAGAHRWPDAPNPLRWFLQPIAGCRKCRNCHSLGFIVGFSAIYGLPLWQWAGSGVKHHTSCFRSRSRHNYLHAGMKSLMERPIDSEIKIHPNAAFDRLQLLAATLGASRAPRIAISRRRDHEKTIAAPSAATLIREGGRILQITPRSAALRYMTATSVRRDVQSPSVRRLGRVPARDTKSAGSNRCDPQCGNDDDGLLNFSGRCCA